MVEDPKGQAFLFGTVLAMGDSLTFGARSALGYPEHLGALLTETNKPGSRVEWGVLNRGISGQTTREILDRTPAAVGQLAGMGGPKWFVLLAGTNDSKGDGASLDQWEALYRQILHWPRRYGIPIALCTFPPVQPGKMPAYTAASIEWLKRASDRVRVIASELDNHPAPVRLIELADLQLDLLCDGVHLTPDGYREMAERIADVLLDDGDSIKRIAVEEVKPRGKKAKT